MNLIEVCQSTPSNMKQSLLLTGNVIIGRSTVASSIRSCKGCHQRRKGLSPLSKRL